MSALESRIIFLCNFEEFAVLEKDGHSEILELTLI